MKEVTFVGEHLLLGNLGKVSIFLSLAASLFAFIAYAFAVNQKEDGHFWKKAGRLGFTVHGLAVASIFITLFFIIQRHYFEYQYAWQHSSRELPLRYMISCFWEGQEGSFLLWMIWHVVVGGLLLWKAKSWESPVMAVIALAQVMLSTMLLGIDVFGIKLGSNPFILIRDAQAELLKIPILASVGIENYLQIIQDGNGLNPLLQNYWMVIHPPTLFLGFAAAIVPFAYAIAGLWTGRLKEWIKPALPWTLFAVMILGTGIIMGGFWAYESLNFGGYWAWDPVENASLIPWLLLIALAHTMLIQQRTGKALYITYILAIFSFLLVLYATFLTRSGVLGETSVHSFTDLGMSGQLLIFFFLFVALPAFFTLRKNWHKYLYTGILLITLIINMVIGYKEWLGILVGTAVFAAQFILLYRYLPKVSSSDDELSSREFWMFIGALTFVISCFHVVINTSIPVWNKLFKLDWAPQTDVVSYYNQWQLPIALLVALMMAFSQFLRYHKSNSLQVKKALLQILILATVLCIPCVLAFKLTHPLFIAFTFAASAAVAGNAWYIYKVLRGKISISGGSIAHVGFGLMLLGIIASGTGKRVVSFNETGIRFAEDEKANRENTLLWRNVPTRMADYEVTYFYDTLIGPDHYYHIRYQRLDPKTGEYLGEEFVLTPNAQTNSKMGLVSNPDTRHYLTHDVFTYVTQVTIREEQEKTPFSNFKEHTVAIGDTIRTNNGLAILKSVTPAKNKAELGLEQADYVLTGNFEVITLMDTLSAHPIFAIKNDMYTAIEDDLNEAGLRLKLTSIKTDPDPANTRFVVETAEREPLQDYVILKAIVFPYINLLWSGTIIMVIGFLLSIFQRNKKKQTEKQEEGMLQNTPQTAVG